MLAVPGGEVAYAGEGDERGEIPIAHGILDEECRRVAVHHQLGADDRAHPGAACLADEADDSAEVGSIGDAHGGVPQLGGALDQRLRGDGTIAEGEGGVGAELGVHRYLRRP
jgi:hypothetical protein